MVHLHVGNDQLRVPRMTPGSPAGQVLDDILARTRCLLLDFDGPVCDIFAGLPAALVAERLRKLITGQAIELPDHIARTADPIEIFTYSATVSGDLAARVEAEMAGQELAAVATARPSAYVHDVVTSCRDSGRLVAVVSNNSDRAVRAYLARHGLDDRVDLVAARTSHDPALLKPSPHLIQQAMTGLGAPPDVCVLVGDSDTDMHAAHRAGVDSIGYANRPGKHTSLTAAGALTVVSSLADLVLGLRARPLMPLCQDSVGDGEEGVDDQGV
jgi:phosphoglycolate phosphatase